MIALQTWSLAGVSNERTWSQAVVLQEKESTSPRWLVCLSLCDTSDAEIVGEELLHQLELAYFNSEKSAKDLLSVLKTISRKQPQVHLVGMRVWDSRVVGFGFGQSGIQLERDGSVADILTNTTNVWRQIEGTLLENDLVVLFVYGTNPPMLLPLSDTQEVSSTLIENELIQLHEAVSIGKAALLVLVQEEAVAVLEPAEIKAETVPWWSRLWKPSEVESAEQRAHHKKVLLAGWMVLSILLISVTVGSQARVNQRLERQYKGLEQQVDQMMIAAEALKSVDQIKARQTVRETHDAVKAAEPMFQKNEKWLKQYRLLAEKVSGYYQSMAAEVAVSEIPTWYSLSIAKPGFTGTKMAYAQEQLLVFDMSSKSLLRIAVSTKRADIVAGGELMESVVAVAMTEKKGYILRDGGIVEVNMVGKTASQVIARDEAWQQPRLLSTFNNNLYVLDGQEIWRYSGLEKKRWLGPGVTVPNQEIVSMVIDGEVWLLTNQGAVWRYRQGASVKFQFTGLDTALGETTALGVAKDQDIIMVLDKTNQRLVVFDKSGVYKKQIKWQGFGSAQAMVMDEAGQYAYILKDGIIYQASL